MTPTDPTRQLEQLQRDLDLVRQDNAALRAQLTRLTSPPAAVDPPKDSLAPGDTGDTLARLRLIIEAAQLALWDWDVARGMVHLSPRWGAFTGEPATGAWQPVESLLAQFHPDDVPHVRQQQADLLAGRSKRYVVEHRVRATTGWIWVESMGLASERNSAGQVTRMIVVNADITARKAVQEELAVAQLRVEQASRAKSEFLANMSHEVRTPLNAIMGLTRLLHQTPTNAQQKDYLGLIDSSATALLALLNDVLDLSKIEAGKLVFEQLRFDLLSWVEQAASPFVAQAQEKGLQVRVEVGPELPQYLVGDPGRLRQVLANLMSNALKFTERGGIRLKVWADPDQRNLAAGQLLVLFEVRDTGIGMTPAQQSGIFDAFTQADASTTRRYGGTGLGLTICARLVEMMDGKIRVVSLPGQGSAFRFSAVFSHASADPTQMTMPAELEARALAGLTVLLAEDHPVNQLLTRKLLEEMGCRVEVASNGEEALARWQGGGIDLLLMDIQMPVLSGPEATARIRAQERDRGGHTPIVALTAHALAGDREKYLSAGMDSYASKPIAPDKLAQAMRDALDAGQPRPEVLLPDFHFNDAGHAMPARERPVAAPLAVKSPPPNPDATRVDEPLDANRLLERLGGDRDALLEIAQAMRGDLADRVEQLRTASDTQDTDLACRQAHTLKGSLSTLTLDRGATLARGLEMAAQEGDWTLFDRTLALLQHEAVRIDAALARIV